MEHKDARIRQLTAIIADMRNRIFEDATTQDDGNGGVLVETATCGECGMSWNDALITSYTPAPSGRCPFEYVHDEARELRRLTHGKPPHSGHLLTDLERMVDAGLGMALVAGEPEPDDERDRR